MEQHQSKVYSMEDFMNNSIIEVKNVSKSFKKEKVLKNISISFEAGKTHGIIGRNGSGKTVLLKMISGLLYPDEGSIFVQGKQIGKDIDFPADIGLIIEAPGFLSYESGYKNLEYLASLRRKIGKTEIVKSIERVGLDPKSRKHVGKYSLGMKQRLGIAQAVMENPSIILLDEPMNGLDRSGVEDIRALLQELKNEGKTILIASHIKDDIELLCDTVCEIDQGNLTVIR